MRAIDAAAHGQLQFAPTILRNGYKDFILGENDDMDAVGTGGGVRIPRTKPSKIEVAVLKHRKENNRGM
jgi:hypothetical protein